MSYNTKNHTEQGGDVTHIGGTLVFDEGGEVRGLPLASAEASGGVKAAEKAETDTQEVKIDPETGKLYVPANPAAASAAAAGLVLKAANVPAAVGEAPTAAEFNALIAALIASGAMAAAG